MTAETKHLSVRAEMWMRDGEWRLLVRAPEWVVGGWGEHGTGKLRRVWTHNYGGGCGGYSFLLGTQTVAVSRRERFARWLLRYPYPKPVKS